MILYKDWEIKIPKGEKMLARQFDNLSRRIDVIGDLPEGWEWAMLVQADKKMDIIPLLPIEGGVGVTLTENQLSIAGYYSLQLRGTRGEIVKHTNVIFSYVADSLSGTGQWPAVPSEFLEVERRILELNEHPPAPGEDGFWRIWNPDTDRYERSDFPLPEGCSDSTLYAVKYVKQELTAEEQLQVRQNINALSKDELSAAVDVALTQAKESGAFIGPAGPRGEKGDTGAIGPAGANGKDGKTPVKGTDYWTAADQQSIVDEVLTALPVWEGGSY